MENNTKKTVAGLTAGAIGVAGAGIVAGNIISDKQEKEISESSIVVEDNSNNDEKVKSAITELTGVSTTTSDNTRTSDTTSTTSIELGNYGMSLEEYRSSKAAAATSTTPEYVGNTSNSTETTVKEDMSKTDTTTTIKDSFTDVDNECYKLLMEAHEGFHSFNIDYEAFGLADAIESNYDVKFSPEQDTRYAYLMRETYLAYCDAIGAYESGDVKSFRKICDEILNSKKYLNLDDLIDILAINMNTESKVVNNSRNYSISKDELVVDGVHVRSLFSNPSYKYRDIMSILSMFDGATPDDLMTLKIMQIPLTVVNEVISPSSFSLECGGVMHEYRNEELGEKLQNINNYFVDKTGLNNFGYEQNGNYYSIYGYDNNFQKQYISSDDEYYRYIFPYTANFYPAYQRSKDGRVGYFDAETFIDYLSMVDEKMQEKSATK